MLTHTHRLVTAYSKTWCKSRERLNLFFFFKWANLKQIADPCGRHLEFHNSSIAESNSMSCWVKISFNFVKRRFNLLERKAMYSRSCFSSAVILQPVWHSFIHLCIYSFILNGYIWQVQSPNSKFGSDTHAPPNFSTL